MLYQGVAKILVLVRRLRASLAVDEVPSGNHRRKRPGATLGGGYGAYRCATGIGGRGPGHTGNLGTAHTSRPFASERFSRRAPAPGAPPLRARTSTQCDKRDGTALSPRRSKLPPTPRPRRKAGGSESRRQADKRSAGREPTHRCARARVLAVLAVGHGRAFNSWLDARGGQ
jgi:hypothetical protein